MSLVLGPRIVLATLWLVSYGGYAIWKSVPQWYWLGIAYGAISVAGGIGALLRLRWSQWLVYFVAVAVVGTWLYYLILAIRSGAFPYETLQLTALGLVPGLILLAAMAWSADIVRRRFQPVASQA
jgi:hypothetical protein